MPWLAVALLTTFLLAVFPVRGVIRRRRFGSAGRPNWQDRQPRRWLAADAMFLSGFAMLIAGPVLEGLHVLDPLFEPGGGLVAAGLVLVAAATMLAVWAQEKMGSAWRPDVPPDAASALVTSGPFRVVRNPNYVAMLAAGLGVVIMAPNVVTLAAWLVAVGSLMLTARIEEPLLAEQYGVAYQRYAGRVGRFVPRVGRLAAPAELPEHGPGQL